MEWENKPGHVYEVTRYRVKYKDVFNLKLLYALLHEWAVEENFGDASDQKFPEAMYWERRLDGGIMEIWAWWRLARDPEGTSFYRYRMDVDYHIVAMKSIEVVHNGKKFKTNNGEVEVNVHCWIEIDPGGEWREHWLLRHFFDMMWKRVLYNDLLARKKRFLKKAYEFQEVIKNYLNLKQYTPKSELFDPQKGMYPQE
ncbi:hypothetical protein JXB02_02555 [Candidatus Woesearchaeota archaeon]|nr:hypothetical protein [Candidatus Woesearchaeota archaeon]